MNHLDLLLIIYVNLQFFIKFQTYHHLIHYFNSLIFLFLNRINIYFSSKLSKESEQNFERISASLPEG